MDSSIAAVLWCPIVVAAFAVIAVMVWWQLRQQRVTQARIREIRRAEKSIAFFDHWDMRCQLEQINGRKGQKPRSLLSVSAEQIVLYTRSPQAPEVLRFTPDQIRWYGRPLKYTSSRNVIWLHIEQDDGWRLLKIRLYQEPMRDLVRVLKQVTAPELVIAYRRQRPYIHKGPVKARPAAQDIHGAWTLDDTVDLYMMPRFLVILAGKTVKRKILLETVQQIGALRRIDQPKADGLVRFEIDGETLAFALPQYEVFAQAMAEAAKRTLEVPLQQKQKGKKDDDWDDE